MKLQLTTLSVLLCVMTAPLCKTMAAAEIGESEQRVYKTVGDVKLKMYIYNPAGHVAADKKPVIVFFFGGGWKGGSPKQFQKQSEYLASRGMVAMSAEYRVSSKHQVKAVSCVKDAKSAIRWVRQHAKQLGINPNQVVAAGGSAGGHLAACTGTILEFDEANEDLEISSKPNAMVLFNPAVVLAPVADRPNFLKAKNLEARMGVDPIKLSPYHHVRKGIAPTLILHGKGDTTVPYWTADYYTAALQKKGNVCQLVGYNNQKHGFFNFGRNGNKNFIATTTEMDKFLTALGYLKGEPTVKEFLK